MWLSHDGFPSIDSFTQKAKSWNKEAFGDIFWKKRNMTATLLGAEKALAKNPLQRMIDIHKFLSGKMEKMLALVEELWGMNSRIKWLI